MIASRTKHCTGKRLRSNRGQGTAELPLALLLLVFFLVMPAINLIAITTDAAVLFLITYQTAYQAAAQPRYAQALTAAADEALALNKSAFAAFAHLTPVNGYQNSGADLYVLATNYQTEAIQTYGPNTPVPPPIDASQFIYEYMTSLNYSVTPFINMANVPFIGKVPGLGKPFPLHFTAHRAVEHVQGISTAQADPSLSSSSPSPQLSLGASGGGNTPGMVASAAGGDWNYPNIYGMIQQSGQTIVAQAVLIVKGTDPWVNTGLTLQPGQNAWIDSRADGTWSNGTGLDYDANGMPATSWPTMDIINGPNHGALVAHVGGNLPPIVGGSAGTNAGPSDFLVGNTLLNYPVTGSGPISLVMNDSYPTDNTGQQIVRIIITQ